MTRRKPLARNEPGEKKEVTALSPVEELEKLRQRLAEVERGQKLGLVWRDIPEDVETLLRDEIPVLIHEKELDVSGSLPSDQAHILIEGDNLHALHVLQATHRGKVDVIYIDPPYNTGKEFIYNDKIVDSENSWRHSAWLSFMQKRLELAQELLTHTGVIIISIDDNEQARLKLLCDSIFGESNFLGTIIRATNSTKSNSNFLSVNYDYTLIYTKNRTSLEDWIKSNGKWEVAKNNVKEYQLAIKKLVKRKLSPEEITLELKELTNYPRFVDFVNYWYVDDRGVYRKDNLGGVTNGNTTPLHNPLTGKLDPVPPGGYRFSTEKLLALVADNRIHFHEDGSLPTIKRYLDENPKQRPKGIMSDDQRPDYNMLSAMGLTFDNPKQLTFIKRILSIFPKDAVILDFFAGSATTLHAVLDLNKDDGGKRQGILVTNDENGICRNVSHVRIKSLLTGKWASGDHDPFPGSLVFYKTSFIKRLKSPDRMRTEIAKHTVDLIAVREGTSLTLARTTSIALLKGSGKTVAVVPGLDPNNADLRKTAEKKVEEGDRKVVYLFTWSDNGVEEEVAALWPGWEVNPLPAEMLAALRRLAPPARLFDDVGGAS